MLKRNPAGRHMIRERRRDSAAPDTGAGCWRHPYDRASKVCADCGQGCCDACCVGTRKRTRCIPCALAFAGVTTRAGAA